MRRGEEEEAEAGGGEVGGGEGGGNLGIFNFLGVSLANGGV